MIDMYLPKNRPLTIRINNGQKVRFFKKISANYSILFICHSLSYWSKKRKMSDLFKEKMSRKAKKRTNGASDSFRGNRYMGRLVLAHFGQVLTTAEKICKEPGNIVLCLFFWLCSEFPVLANYLPVPSSHHSIA